MQPAQLVAASLGVLAGGAVGLTASPGAVLVSGSVAHCLCFLLLAGSMVRQGATAAGIFFGGVGMFSGALPLRLWFSGPGSGPVRLLSALQALLAVAGLSMLARNISYPVSFLAFVGAPAFLLACAVWRPYGAEGERAR